MKYWHFCVLIIIYIAGVVGILDADINDYVHTTYLIPGIYYLLSSMTYCLIARHIAKGVGYEGEHDLIYTLECVKLPDYKYDYKKGEYEQKYRELMNKLEWITKRESDNLSYSGLSLVHGIFTFVFTFLYFTSDTYKDNIYEGLNFLSLLF